MTTIDLDDDIPFDNSFDAPSLDEHIEFFYPEKDLKCALHFSELSFSKNEFGEKMASGTVSFDGEDPEHVALHKILTKIDVDRLAQAGYTFDR